jgi:hypothetical protein
MASPRVSVHHRGRMAMIRDLLFQLVGSGMAEDELADELRTDRTTVRACLERLGAAAIVQGPIGTDRQWSAVPADAPFDTIVATAKAAGVDLRVSLTEFVAQQRA